MAQGVVSLTRHKTQRIILTCPDISPATHLEVKWNFPKLRVDR